MRTMRHGSARRPRGRTGVRTGPVPAPPAPPGLDSHFGTTGQRSYWDVEWTVPDESKVYRTKNLEMVVWPDLPSSMEAKNDYDTLMTLCLSAIDRTANDTLTAWLQVALHPEGDSDSVIQTLDQNSQGLYHLDKYMGVKLINQKSLNHPLFGLEIVSYIGFCKRKSTSPKGRVIVALAGLRFRYDLESGNLFTALSLYDITLDSYKISDIRVFIGKVRYVLQRIPNPEEIQHSLAYTWLWRQFRNWPKIARHVEDMEDAPRNDKRRSWVYLWSLINNKVNRLETARNEEQEAAHWQNPFKRSGGNGKAVPGAVSVTHYKQDQTTGQWTEVPGAPAKPGKKKKGKGKGGGKGKGDDQTGKGKGPKGPKPKSTPKGKGKGKGADGSGGGGTQTGGLSAKEKAEIDRILAKPHPQRTVAERAKVPCRFAVLGSCPNGTACEYNHSKRFINARRAELGITHAMTAAFRNSKQSAAASSKTQPKSKATPPKDGGKAPALTAKAKRAAKRARRAANAAKRAGAHVAVVTEELPSMMEAVGLTL